MRKSPTRFRRRGGPALDIDIRPARDAADIEEALQLLRTVFGERDTWELRSYRLAPACYRPRWSYIARAGGRAVGHCGAVPHAMRFGLAEVPAVEICWVGVHPDFTGRGVGTRLVAEALAASLRGGVALAYLFGIPGFYERLGFTKALVDGGFDPTVILTPAEREQARPDLPRVRIMKPEDLPALAAMRRREDAGRIGAIARPPRAWECQFSGLAEMGRADSSDALVAEEAGRIRGYARFEKDARDGRLWLREASVMDADAAEALRAAAARLVWDECRHELPMKLPHDSPFARHCFRRGALLKSYTHGGYVRPLDIAALSAAAAPLVADRLGRSRHYDWNGVIEIATREGTARFPMGRGRTDAVRLRASPEQFTRALFGFTCGLEEFRVPRERRGLVAAAFPEGHPYVWWFDRQMI
jgi:putative acetyltransferase